MRVANLKTILSGVFLIESPESYLPLVKGLLAGDGLNLELDFQSKPPLFYSKAGESYDKEHQLPEEQSSVVVLHLDDVIMKYSDGCGLVGTQEYAEMLKALFADDRVAGIVFEVDSPGGAGNAIECLTSVIDQRNKPVLFHVNGLMASAAYWIACAGDGIYSDMPNSEIGSIGSMWTLMNPDGFYEKQGVKITRLYASQSSKKNAAVRQVMETGKTDLAQKELDEHAGKFISAVNQYRGIPEDDEVMTGGVYNTEQALSFNLIDGKLNLASVIEKCFELSESFEPKTDKEMFGKDKKVSSLKNLNSLMTAKAEDRTPEMVAAANKELQDNGLDAVLVARESYEAQETQLNDLKGVKDSLDQTQKEFKDFKESNQAAQSVVDAATELFGDSAKEEDFDLPSAIDSLIKENEKLSKVIPGGKAATKEGDDPDAGGEEESVPVRSQEEEKMLKELGIDTE